MSKEFLHGQDVAEAAFEDLADYMGADIDVSENDDGYDELQRIKRKIVKAVRAGYLVVDEDGKPTLKTSGGVSAAFRKPTGATLLARPPGKSSDNDDPMRRMLAIISELTGGELTPAKMSPREVGVALAITSLFMAELS